MPDYLITWVHLAAAIVLIGGLLYSQLVLNPVARGTPSDSTSREVVRLSGRRFRTIAWVCLIVLILTGAYQMLNESGSARIETAWGVVLMLKLLLFAIAFGLLLIHDFIIDPYAPSSQDASTPASSPTVQARADTLQKAVIVMTLAVLLVASYLSKI
ncbi:MAG: CopD family protein [Nitrospira sp.]|nr:CopD family protein [Nitrospira sp.]